MPIHICTCSRCKTINPKGVRVTRQVKVHHSDYEKLKRMKADRFNAAKQPNIAAGCDVIQPNTGDGMHICVTDDEMISDVIMGDSVADNSSYLGQHEAPSASLSTGSVCSTSNNDNVLTPANEPSMSESSVTLRRSSRPRKPRTRQEVVSLVEQMQQQLQEQVAEQSAGANAATGEVLHLGLYDDPDDLDAVQRELAKPEPPPPLPFDDIDYTDYILSEIDPQPPKGNYLDIFHRSHDIFFVRIILIIVTFLHIKHTVSFHACSVLLTCMNSLFVYLGLIPSNDSTKHIPTSFATVIRRLGLKDRFGVYPTCAKCHRIFVRSVPVTAQCPSCKTALFNPPSRSLFKRLTGRMPPPPPPICATPIQTLSSLLHDFFLQDGMEDAVELWKHRATKPGLLYDIMDGKVWQSLKGTDGKNFFDSSLATSEIRLGVTLSLDWFGRKTSVYGPSNSSGALSFCISNLPAELRYRVQNLLVAAMTPGPTEPTSEQLQNYLRVLVDDLIYLYETGILVQTAAFPEGRLVRVVLLAVVCDHPAMCKLGGFGDHAHNAAPCPKCKVSGDHFFSESSLRNEFDPRTGSEVRKQCYKWWGLSTPERAKFFKEHGTRWSELARLSYFDIVRCSIIDPMHNLLLGVVKTQWFSQWIQEKVLRKATATHGRELDFIHNFLATFETPLWMGKLPHRVGEPAGGSLTADEYKLAALVAFPLIIPIVWDNFGDAATAELASAQDLYERNLAKYEKERAQWLAEQVANAEGEPRAEPTPPKQPHLCMKHGEVHNFLRLSTSLKIFFSPVVDTSKLQRAQDLLQDYLLGFRTLYPDSDMKPNHHWSVHLKDQIHDYGPVYTFWTFLGERLNKTLKSFNSNGWTGGQVEISMMRYFGREAQLDALVKAVLKHINPLHASNDEKLCLDVGMRMFGLSPEACGTVQDSASSLRYTIVAEAGPVVQSAKLSSRICAALHSYYNGTGLIRVHHPLDSPSSNTVSFVLRDRADYINYVTYSGRRITPTSRSQRNSAGSSIVLAKLDGKQFAGELVSVFQHFQPGFRNTVLFAEMKWMRPFEEELPTDNVWLEFPELGVQFWEYNSYLTPDSIGSPPLVIPFSYIQGQLARGVIDCWDPPFWITTTLAQISMDLRTNYDNSSDQDSNDSNSVTAL